MELRQATVTLTEAAVLIERQESLRRVATLVARGAAPADVFAAVAQEIARCAGTEHAVLHRHDPASGTTVLVASRDSPLMKPMPVGARFTLEGPNVNAMIMATGRPARIDDYEGAPGSTADRIRALGIRSAVGVPIIDDGRLWGTAIVASTRPNSLPPDTEARMADFADLVATAINFAETRAELIRSREQQAGLRRVATLVARGASATEVFDAITHEAALSFCVGSAVLVHYEPAGTFVVLATCDPNGALPLPLGERFPLDGDNVAARVFRTGRPARMDSHGGAAGHAAARLRAIGIISGVGAPIIVGGKLWGAVIVGSSSSEPFAADAEDRIAEFTDLAATAISNAEAHAELTASRSRIVAAGDEARRRLERDLHDGAQQRLVSLALEVRALERSTSTETPDVQQRMRDIVDGLVGVTRDLQELSRGIHPAILAQGGLDVALRTLARQSSVPVNLEVNLHHPMAKSADVAAYYFVAEALTNIAKHAHAQRVTVSVCTSESSLAISIGDDGVGGADPRNGSGLVGLIDRIEALGGRLFISSSPGTGTHLRATLPIDDS